MRWVLIALVLFLVTPAALGEQLDIHIHESGRITDYLNSYWVVNVNGSGTITNPSDRDLFDVRLYFDSLGLSVIDHGGLGSFEGDSLVFDHLSAGSSADFSYQMVGITAEPPTLRNKGVLYTGLAKKTPRIYSDIFGELQKAPLEDPSVTNRDARLISMTLQNPTSFRFNIDEARVIKTPTLNPNTKLAEWNLVIPTSPQVLDPGGMFVRDFIDEDAREGEVYWLQTEVYISNFVLHDNNTIMRYTEENLTVPSEILNFTNQTDNGTSSAIVGSYLLRRELSDRVAIPGEPLTVSLIIHNFGDSLEPYSLTDRIPPGFIADSDLEWEGSVPARGTSVVRYRAILNDSSSPGIDNFPSAELLISGLSLRSPEVSYVRQFVPDDRLYVQKQVRYRDDDNVAVSISVQNLGRSTISGASLREFLSDGDTFTEITQSPESKGLWKLPSIASGDTWEVSYVTESSSSLTTLPAVYGVPSQNVLRSIVLENVVSEAWQFVRTNTIEITGVGLLVLLPALFLFGRRYGWFAA